MKFEELLTDLSVRLRAAVNDPLVADALFLIIRSEYFRYELSSEDVSSSVDDLLPWCEEVAATGNRRLVILSLLASGVRKNLQLFCQAGFALQSLLCAKGLEIATDLMDREWIAMITYLHAEVNLENGVLNEAAVQFGASLDIALSLAEQPRPGSVVNSVSVGVPGPPVVDLVATPALPLVGLGLVEQARGRLEAALSYFLKAEQHCRRSANDNNTLAHVTGRIAMVYYLDGRFVDAELMYRRQIDLAVRIGDKRMEAYAFGGIGSIKFVEGKYEDAFRNHSVHFTMCKSVSDLVGQAIAAGNLASYYLSKNDIPSASKILSFQVEYAEVNQDIRQLCSAFGGYGNMYACQGLTSKAVESHEKSHSYACRIGDRVLECFAACNLGNALLLDGQYERAASILQSSIDFHSAHPTEQPESEAPGLFFVVPRSQRDDQLQHQLAGGGSLVSRLAQQASDSGDDEPATEPQPQTQSQLHSRPLSQSQTGLSSLRYGHTLTPRNAHLITLYSTLGCALLSMGRRTDALEALERGLSIALRARSAFHTAVSLLNMANVAIQFPTLHGEVERWYQQAHTGFQRCRCSAGIAASCAGLGAIAHERGAYDEAIRYHSVDRSLSSQVPDFLGEYRAVRNLGLAYRGQMDLKQSYIMHEAQMTLAKKIGSQGELVKSYLDLAIVCQALMNLNRAEEHLRNAVTTTPTEESIIGLQVRCTSQLNALLRNEYRLCHSRTSAVIAYCERLCKNRPPAFTKSVQQMLVAVYRNDCSAYRLEGNFPLAVDMAKRCLLLACDHEDVEAQVFSYGNLADFAILLNQDYKLSQRYRTSQLQLAERCGNKVEVARAHVGLGLLALKKGDPGSCTRHLGLALGSAKKNKDMVPSEYEALVKLCVKHGVNTAKS